MKSTPRTRFAGCLLVAAIGLGTSAAPALAAPHAALRVRLRADADVGALHVTLGDIAAVTGDDAALVARLAGLEVGGIAADGAASVVDRATLARWVRSRAAIASQDIDWSGAEHCSVRHVADAAPVRPVAAEARVKSAATQALVARGRSATLRSVDGVIAVESRVEVREDGVAGQDVHVRLPNATADVMARVTGLDRVEVLR
jgi:hypothetical protein